MTESTQHLLDKIRPPRVQITYDVEVGDAIEMKSLPFIVGVIADLSGDRDPNNPLPSIKQRKFAEIDRDNFNEIMGKIAPRCAFQVDNKLADDNTQLNLLLNFASMDDFDPVSVIKQVPAMAKLYETRTKLKDLLTKLDGNDDLETMLTEILDNTDAQNQMKKDLNISDAPAGGDKGADAKPKGGDATPPKK